MTKKLAAEFIGTFTLVLFGCGAAVLAGFGIIGQLGIAFAFGLALTILGTREVWLNMRGVHVKPELIKVDVSEPLRTETEAENNNAR